ncbi:uncharacterized protein VTP21DRAFT_4437 [Calcarisporiella thermophila]|uniref:uncharacterized protein n=1 Tax=Calcarisporiella thermophila TaxID=911321 RepID=UPI0037443937
MPYTNLHRNPSPPPGETQCQRDRDLIRSTVAGVMIRIITATEEEAIDKLDTGQDAEDDTPFERALCACWDISSIEDYAIFMFKECQAHRLMLKIITFTDRPRTMELAMGILANLATFPDISSFIAEDKDAAAIVGIVLNEVNDPRTLLETCRFLRNLLSSPRLPHVSGTPMPFYKLTSTHGIIPQMLFIASNTLNSDLLKMILEALKMVFCCCELSFGENFTKSHLYMFIHRSTERIVKFEDKRYTIRMIKLLLDLFLIWLDLDYISPEYLVPLDEAITAQKSNGILSRDEGDEEEEELNELTEQLKRTLSLSG